MSISGTIFNIQRYSIHDGPGIRTTVFLKGCTLSCFWCHNPEGRKNIPEVQFYPDRCITCLECVSKCVNEAHLFQENLHIYFRDRCVGCGLCVETCYSEALVKTGTVFTAEEVMEEILRDRLFYETSDGGVTLSGGEPILQPEFSLEILKRCKEEGLLTAIETCGHYPWKHVEPLLPYTDLIMMDLKHLNEDKHREVSGASNQKILENARRFALTDKPIIFRTPVIPSVNDDPADIQAIVGFIKNLINERASQSNGHVRQEAIQYELLPFHKLASDKYNSLGMEYSARDINPPSKEKMCQLADLARASSIDVIDRN